MFIDWKRRMKERKMYERMKEMSERDVWKRERCMKEWERCMKEWKRYMKECERLVMKNKGCKTKIYKDKRSEKKSSQKDIGLCDYVLLSVRTTYQYIITKLSDSFCTRENQGVFPVTVIIAFLPIERVLSVKTDPWISTVPRGSERSEWASLWMKRAKWV